VSGNAGHFEPELSAKSMLSQSFTHDEPDGYSPHSILPADYVASEVINLGRKSVDQTELIAAFHNFTLTERNDCKWPVERRKSDRISAMSETPTNTNKSTGLEPVVSPRNSRIQKSPEETSEFFVPQLGLNIEDYILAENKQGIHHVGRYTWATKVLADLNDKRLVDIACGAGYGSYMLARALPSCTILGGDYDPDSIACARKDYSRKNLAYASADVVSWTYLDSGQSLGTVDVVTSFDTIEHLLHREICLINITENLAEDGVLLISTPVKVEPILNPGWEHHKLEYSYGFLTNLMKRLFEEVLVPGDAAFPCMDFWDNVINKDKHRYHTYANPIVCRKPIKFGL
jgi:2-polyprenyl-3-methyl-5-hydroxy-6-metoxy-1,4-benzoquinol methylase